MYFMGMSDWNLDRLEDIDWNVFGKSDDHIVPNQGGEWLDESSAQGDAHKKPRHEVKNEVEKNMCSRGSAVKSVLWGQEKYYPPTNSGSSSILEGSQSHTSNIVVPTLSDERTVKGTTALPCQDGRVLDYYVNESSSDAKSNMFCLKDPSLGTSGLTNDSKSCFSSLNGLSPDVTDYCFLENEQKDSDSDLAYYDWPDIDNFKDFDKMFRNWDSTFGQGQTGSADELSWFSSSSNIIYGSEIAFESGFQSSSSDLSVLYAQLESRCPNGIVLPKNLSTAAVHDKPTSNYADGLGTDAPSKGKSAGKEESCGGGDGLNNPEHTQISNEYSLNRSGASDIKIKSQLSSEDKGTKRSSDQMLFDSGVLASQIYSQQFSQQNHCTGSSSSYPHSLGPRPQLDFGLLVHQVPVTKIISSVASTSYKASDHIVNPAAPFYMPRVMASEENMEKLNQNEQSCSTIAEHPHQQPAFQNKVSAKKNLLESRDGTETEMDDLGLELPTIDLDLPIAQESSGTTSISFDDISEKVTSFQKLQDVMHQLDVTTKLCIRDSLYRLARSARQRHGFTTQNFCEGTSVIKGIQGIEASNRTVGFMDAETNTNPIDRSIANLLFHKPSERVTGCTVAMSLESPIMNEQAQVPVANHVLIPKQFDRQSTFATCSDMQTDLP